MSGQIAREEIPVTGRRPGRVSAPARRARWIVAVGLAALVGAAFWVVFTAPRAVLVSGRFKNVRLIGIDRAFPPGGRFAGDPYIGSRICAECHPGESALQSRSGHARTLRPAGRLPLARRLDGRTVEDPDSSDVRWGYRYGDGQLSIARRAPSGVEECIAEYAFGSGHHATTFVNVIDPTIPAILEHRLTHYTREDILALTPGHETKPPPPGMTPLGGVPPPRDARNCFGCHATQLSLRDESRIDEAMMIPNVSCERCHGPGRAHVEAARRGAPESELTLPLGLERWTAAGLLQFCGECHRHPAGPRPEQIRPDDPNLARFQPIGLLQSKCYRESKGALSCVSCHDPHARASSDRPSYDLVCLGCHGGSPGTTESTSIPPARGPGCPVSPEGRCVECHMPRVAVDPGRHVLLSDHWIRIRRDEGSTPAEGRRARGTDSPNPGRP